MSNAICFTREELFGKTAKSLDWLRENYSHIWLNPNLNVDQKAGFLSACCDSRRCHLATLSLHERIHSIRVALIQEGME